MADPIAAHCREVDRCNQRGGRMLSIADLIRAGTFTPDLAAWSLAAIGGGKGASFIVGARPGGAGKTTVMGALLGLLPPAIVLAPADGLAAIDAARRSPAPRRCMIGHEIGPGAYYAYLWGTELRAYFGLPAAGHLLATNLHADTIDEARDQICRENGVSLLAFGAIEIFYFISVGAPGRPGARRIASVWETDGRGGHQPIFPRPDGAPGIEGSRLADAPAVSRARRTIDRTLDQGARTIEEVRRIVVAADAAGEA